MITDNMQTVLVVDDDPTNLGVIFECLRQRSFKVLVAEDGESAIERALYARPDIILLDVMMSGISGFETCRRLKADASTRDIPVIFMTALSDASHKVESFRVGGADYVTKPCQHEEILARVEHQLRLRHLQQGLAEQNELLQREVTLRRQAETSLQAHVARLRASNDELDAFARTVAHDLKDPLTQIVGCANLLDETTRLPAEQREFLEIIMQTGEQMGECIDSLLLLARIRDARVIARPVDMVDVVGRAQERLTLRSQEARSNLVILDELVPAMGYAPWLEEVWANYLSNAIKYGGRPARVEVGCNREAGERVRYWVRDNGAGLTVEEQAGLFSEFTRIGHAEPGGHGLGLSIVKRIVDRLGGEVAVDSRPGQGSTFSFTLPEASEAVAEPPTASRPDSAAE